VKSVPILELHGGKPSPAPVKCTGGAIDSTRTPSLWTLKRKMSGHCTACCLHRVEEGHGPLPNDQACCKEYLPFKVNLTLGVYWIIYALLALAPSWHTLLGVFLTLLAYTSR